MQQERIQALNDRPLDESGTWVLYWMQQSQRSAGNPALEYAIRQANDLGKGLIVGFGLSDDYPDANARHFAFMLQGLREVDENLRQRGIKFIVRKGSPDQVALDLAEQAALIVCDRGYLRHQRAWRQRVATESRVRVMQIEGDLIVPLEVASDKAEYAARTIRPKIDKLRDRFITAWTENDPETSSLRYAVKGDIDPSDPEKVLSSLQLDRDVQPVATFTGGTSEARRRLTGFLRSDFQGYADGRGEPGDWQVSTLSPYLHFGQISPVEIALKVQQAESGTQEDRAALLEELIVRRELAANFVYYNDDYDNYKGVPEWARKTLDKHRDDERKHRYTRKQLEDGETHDPYWNAAMREMRDSGYMHNTMRMYWGKQIIQWSNTPEYAWKTAIYLNNRYFLDGRDASSWTNISWLFGLHDRPWKEREVLGTVRSMTRGGLDRKYDMQRYVDKVCSP